MELAALIEALAQPSAYPEPVDAVEVRQTHISVVFLAGPYVYKLKKPVNLGFLDFSDPAQRLHYCQREVELNRRLAPDVYLGVVPINRSAAGIHFEGAGEAIEWAVKMRRLPESATLEAYLHCNEVSVELVEALARKIAGFHRTAETNEHIASFGRIAGVSHIILDIYNQSAAQVGTTVSRAVWERAKKLTEEALSRHPPLIEQRAARGLTRDCHGDLHLDHVYYFPDKPPPGDMVIIDCIEFNERFRFTDVIADMAFPLMDFKFANRRDLASAYADAYFQATGDSEGRALLPMYVAYRASVRGTVEGILIAEKEVSEATRQAARTRSKAHWLLTLGELEAPSKKPCMLLLAGLPGTGKSSLARGLIEQANFTGVRTDEIRKILAELPTFEPTPKELRKRLYSSDHTERTYAKCLELAEMMLFNGQRVLIDATFREEKRRQIFLQAAARLGVPGVMLECRAAPETVRRRLQSRRGDASDADWDIYQRAAREWEALSEATRRAHHVVATDAGPEDAIARALQVLRKLELQDP